ncbi:hypothetical protein Tco_0911996 [Tanacetum coccineum]
MTILVDKAIISGADNHPPMLEKDMYDSWKSRMELYMMNRQHGRMILESIENGPLIWPSIEENRVTRPKKYSELSPTEAIQADYDVKATNIILQGLPPEVYALVSNHKVAKELWKIIQLLMQGTSLTKQERECKLYDEFDKFAYKKGELLRDFYLRFSLLLNDMNIYNMKLEQFQVNTKFLNTLPPEWSKFVTDVKLYALAELPRSAGFSFGQMCLRFLSSPMPLEVTFEQENESEEQESDSEQEEESEDDDQEEEEFVHTPTDDKDDDNLESESDDVIKSDEEKGMDDTTYQFDDDVDARLKEPTQTDKEVVEDAHVTISTVTKKTEVLVTSSSRSSDLASKFLKFSNITHADVEIVSPLDVHVYHEVPRTQAPTLLTILVFVITESSPSFDSMIEITTLEKEVAELKKDPLHPHVTTLVDEHLDTRLGETIEEFMNFLSESLTARIKEQVKDQQPQILPKEVSNFAPPMIKKLIKESRDEVTLAKVSSQLQSTYEAASTLTEFELKKILLDKMEKSESYLTAPEHRDCYDGLKKFYALNKDFFYSYDVYSLKRGRKDKDKDEDPSTGSDRGLKKRKTSKDAEPITSQKKKDSTSGSSKGTKSQPKSFGKYVQSEEPVFEVTDSDMPQDQEGNLGDYENEPRNETALRRDWFKKPTPPQEPTDPNWNISKITQEGPTQNWLMTLAASTSTDKSLKDFDEWMSTPIDFSGYILNGLKIENLTQEILLGPAFRLLKGTCSNYAELKYEFKECYKALSEKLDWENLEGGEYPLDLSKPLSLIKHGKCQRVPVEFFINNDLKYLQGGILTMTYTTYTTKTKATKYDLPGIEDMVPNIWSPVKVAYDIYALWGISHWRACNQEEMYILQSVFWQSLMSRL